eukprot:CAMPEP_0172602508 /NCGR_PEP_ID=MMETSP1068-20121228/22687_1 /TAXON_ID=35684 /ORGANISM="Pseudopedinella elastica, Strain CCMP716" /LENGTH=179 /DNA_ID=CAMNT_0013403881 /DNA_START=223 /DNA_END=758 /DNA_ORIENTATION=+
MACALGPGTDWSKARNSPTSSKSGAACSSRAGEEEEEELASSEMDKATALAPADKAALLLVAGPPPPRPPSSFEAQSSNAWNSSSSRQPSESWSKLLKSCAVSSGPLFSKSRRVSSQTTHPASPSEASPSEASPSMSDLHRQVFFGGDSSTRPNGEAPAAEPAPALSVSIDAAAAVTLV